MRREIQRGCDGDAKGIEKGYAKRVRRDGDAKEVAKEV